jgi:hypothetical protein
MPIHYRLSNITPSEYNLILGVDFLNFLVGRFRWISVPTPTEMNRVVDDHSNSSSFYKLAHGAKLPFFFLMFSNWMIITTFIRIRIS